jgi:hypothetical protein
MKTYFTAAVAIFAILLFSSGGLLVTHAETTQAADGNYGGHGSQSQALVLNIPFNGGGVVSAGNQRYSLSEYGTPLLAMVNGVPLSNPHLWYNLEANVQGMSVTGRASFTITGQGATGNVVLSGDVQISSSVPAMCFVGTPNAMGSTMDPGCTGIDTSQVPAAFVGLATVQTSSNNGNNGQDGKSQGGNGYGGNGHDGSFGSKASDQGQNAGVSVPMTFESPYFNPFGQAIYFGDAASTGVPGASTSAISILVVTDYTHATIAWSNVNDAGMVMGTLGSTRVNGILLQVASEYENLVSGNALDYGTFTLTGMADGSGNSVPALDATGNYAGTSTIPPAAPGSGCGTILMYQVCTNTGFQDQGHFFLKGGQGSSSSLITGSYSSTWQAPALGIASSTITATVYQRQ